MGAAVPTCLRAQVFLAESAAAEAFARENAAIARTAPLEAAIGDLKRELAELQEVRHSRPCCEGTCAVQSAVQCRVA